MSGQMSCCCRIQHLRLHLVLASQLARAPDSLVSEIDSPAEGCDGSCNPARPAFQTENAWPVRDRRTRLDRPGAVTRGLFRSIFRSVCILASGSPFNRLIPCKVKKLAAFVPRRHFGAGLQDMISRKVCKVLVGKELFYLDFLELWVQVLG
jgi:hypothetical protein